jgi:hypothetical protein
MDLSAPSHPDPVVLLSREAENLDMRLGSIPSVATHPKEGCKLPLGREKQSHFCPSVSAEHVTVYLVSIPINFDRPLNTLALSSAAREALEAL